MAYTIVTSDLNDKTSFCLLNGFLRTPSLANYCRTNASYNFQVLAVDYVCLHTTYVVATSVF